MKRKTVIIISVVIVVLALVAIGATVINGRKKKNEEEEKMEVVRRGEFILKVRESGNLEPLVSVEVRSNVEGEIKGVYVKEGDFVEKGRKLMQIDDQQIREQKRQAEANRDVRKAQFKQAGLRIYLTEKQQESEITQAQNAVSVAEAGLAALQATTVQRITQAETDVATTKNLLEQDRIARRQADILLQQAQLTLEQYQAAEESAKIAYETAEAEFNRHKELFRKKFVSKKALEDAEARHASTFSQYKTARKNVESQLKAVESQEQNIEARKRAIDTRQATLRFQEQNLISIKEAQDAQRKQLLAELQSAQTRLQQILETTAQEKELTVHSEVGAKAGLLEAESNLTAQEERLGWTKLVAPMSGTVTQLEVEEGEIVTSGRSAFSRGGPAILTIADLSRMVVTTKINEVEIAKITVGQEVEVRVEAYRDKVFEGRVSEIAPSADIPEMGRDGIITFEVIIEVIGSPSELLPGMSADVDIIVVQQHDILQLPIEAVIESEVLIVKANVPAEYLARFRLDQEVEVQNLIGKKFPGKVGKIWTGRERGNLELLLDGTPQGLRTGPTGMGILISDEAPIQSVEAQIESEKKYFVQLDKEIPQKAKKKDKKKEEKGVKTRIEVGLRNNSHFEILSGVLEGDRVFVPSMEQLTQKDQR